MKKTNKSVIDIMGVISKRIDNLDNAETEEQRAEAIEDAQIIIGLSKQFLNAADIIVRSETLLAKRKALNEAKLNMLVGQYE